VTVPATGQTYRERLAAALSEGWRFADLHASADGSQVRALLTDGAENHRIETAPADAAGSVQSIVDLVPAAGWDEREAHDQYGVGFEGHEPLRPLVDHTTRLDRWTVPVRGHDPYQVAVGPIHAGVIESGHFRFHVVGDRILHLDARLFYKHRGLENAAEGATLDQGLAFAARACGACEDALGLAPRVELAHVRTVLLELERTWNHLNDISQICAGVGLAAGTTRFAGLTERARRLNAALTGHRFLFGSVQVGGSNLRITTEKIRSARAELATLRAEAATTWRELAFNTSFQDRLPDVGTVRSDEALRLGAVGPAARASGLAEDLRAASPRLAYSGFEPVIPQRATGDVQARLEQRALELWQTFAILDRLLDDPIEPAAAVSGDPPKPIGVGRVESPRGATTCIVEHQHDRIRRLRLRTGSYANWPVLAHAATDNLLPDFPLINKSFELCYACVDR
jgi:Ni,Fe-hydrogenase III large subunit